jgi:peroxiredoxin
LVKNSLIFTKKSGINVFQLFLVKINISVKHFFLIVFAIFIIQNSFAQNNLPSVELRNLKGQKVNLNSLHQKGKYLIISFWATWCVPCRKETEKINALLPEWQKQKDVEMIAISIDDSRTAPKVKSFVQTQKWNFPVYLDVNSDTKRALNYQAVPYLIVLDKEGKIIYRHNGYKPGDENEVFEALK